MSSRSASSASGKSLSAGELAALDDGKLDLRSLSDAQIQQALYWVEAEDRGNNFERILCEIARRGGKSWAEFLSTDSLLTWHTFTNHDSKASTASRNAQTLTVLRRLQHRPDPLRIDVDKTSVRCTYPDLPEIHARVTNVDAERLPVEMRLTGDAYEWRIEVRNAHGELVPIPKGLDYRGGGMGQIGPLKFGEKLERTLAIGDWLPPLPPGEYIIHIQRHSQEEIAYRQDMEGVIYANSAAISLAVEPMTLRDKPETRQRVMELFSKLAADPAVRIVGGTYGSWAYGLVAPTSYQGQLLAIGLPAVLPLLDKLEDPALTPHERSLALGLLYSLTGLNAPIEAPYMWFPERLQEVSGVIGPYRGALGRWNVCGTGATTGRMFGEPVGQEPIDLEKQRDFALRWKDFRQFIKVAPKEG